jgi:integral membrane protein (TIGR01906 family)
MILKTAARWLFVLCLPVILITASVSAAVNSTSLYTYGFEKYNVGETTGLPPTELEKAARGLIDYFNSGEEFISVTVTKDGETFPLFNDREVGHLKDVKGLFQMVYWLLAGSLAYGVVFSGVSLFLWRDRRGLASGLMWGGGLTLALMVAMGLGTLFSFDQLFLQFHLLSFANDLWILNPTTDYLIMLFPQGFWFDAALYCSLAAAVGAAVLTFVGWRLSRANRGP